MPYRFGDPWTPVARDVSPGYGMLPSQAQPQSHLRQGSIYSMPRTAPQVVSDYIVNSLTPVVGPVMANRTANLIDWSPIGAAAQGYQGGQDMRRGRWLSGALGAGGALLSWMPGGKMDARVLGKLL